MLKARLGFVVGREGFLSLQGGGKDGGLGALELAASPPREWNGGAGGRGEDPKSGGGKGE